MDPRRGDKTFPSLGDPPFPEECRDLALAELREAGLPRGSATVLSREVEVLVKGSDAERMASAGIYVPAVVATAPKEWVNVYSVEAEAFGWTFRRAWYYWVCRTVWQPVALSVAEKLHEAHGREVRCYGDAGAPAPTEPVMDYHVDTPAGLAALVAVLRQAEKEREAEKRRQYEAER